MAKRNGSIIGKVNTPTTSVATGVWRLQDQFNAKKNSIWPLIPYSIDFLVVAGGGGADGKFHGSGAGAGGYRTSTQNASIGTVITVTVGDGGAGGVLTGVKGNDSSISGTGLTTITSTGGGLSTEFNSGNSGGSGGGGLYSAGAGNTPNTSPSQGNNGGVGFYGAPYFPGGGGGGANAVGDTAPNASTVCNGGAGTASSITGSSLTRAGGGGGSNITGSPSGSGGSGGGGNGGGNANGSAGTANTGGGGGGGGNSGGNADGGAGGKGVVILSLPAANYSGTTTGSPTVTDNGSLKVLQFNGSGSYTA
jgi:hypothetical protein